MKGTGENYCGGLRCNIEPAGRPARDIWESVRGAWVGITPWTQVFFGAPRQTPATTRRCNILTNKIHLSAFLCWRYQVVVVLVITYREVVDVNQQKTWNSGATPSLSMPRGQAKREREYCKRIVGSESRRKKHSNSIPAARGAGSFIPNGEIVR